MRAVLSLMVIVPLVATAACGGDDDAASASASGRPQIVVTTSILGDIVGDVVGEAADVEVVMPVGADPHEFAASARQAETMRDADLLVVNGAGFEEGLGEIIDSVEAAGTASFAFADHVDLRDGDPHLWTDPSLVAGAMVPLADALAAVDGIDVDAVRDGAVSTEQALLALDADIAAILDAVPADRRVLVTNHEALGYFAARYDLDVVGAVIPSQTTAAGSSAAALDSLADVMRDEGVTAIFGETTQPTELAEALADEVGEQVEVVALYTESLGEDGSGAETYAGMLRTDAELIVGALS